MRRLPRDATNALLIAIGLLLAVAVGVDVQRRIALAQRMRVDRHVLRVYLKPQVVDPQAMTISVRRARDLVCVPARGHAPRHGRVCIHVVHTGHGAWGVVRGSRIAGEARRHGASAVAQRPLH
ncbi:MAG: hypothetical protein LC685_01345 [Actinobacteria bacterium]|nr:hypothetical protein [Actinomycetota bacterium]